MTAANFAEALKLIFPLLAGYILVVFGAAATASATRALWIAKTIQWATSAFGMAGFFCLNSGSER